jgi:cbb3-type cytochrome oxidase subunit 3
MGLILLEALLALCIFIVIVWWTMFSGRSKGELRQAPVAPDQAPNEASPHAPGAALSEAAPTPAPTATSTNQATPDDSRR